MILSGPKSYYDDFVRKKDTSRTLHDPPSLLTDRGAYMNFLEVQLERVSAACLGVQSYDDRFNDMQTLIVSLDKKCASTARLVSISQQCTEQLRIDTEAKLDKLTQEVRAESWETKRLLEVMSTRIAAVEHKVADLPLIHQRLDDDAARTKAVIEDIQKLSEETDSKINNMNCLVNNFESTQQSMFQDVEGLKTADSKLQFDLAESERRYQNMFDKAEIKHAENIAESEDKMLRNVHIASTKIAGDMEALQVEVAAKEAGCLAAVRLLGESLREETLKVKERIEKHIAGVGEELNSNVENQMKKVNRSLSDQFDVINEEIESQNRKICSLNENNRVQFKQLDRTLGSITKDQLLNLTNSLDTSSLVGATSNQRNQSNQNGEGEGKEGNSFCLSSATRAAAGTQRQALQQFPLEQPSRAQIHRNQHSQQIPSSPSDILLSSMNELDAPGGHGLTYIGSGLYVDTNRVSSPMGTVRDSNNNVLSEIKPSCSSSDIQRDEMKEEHPQGGRVRHGQQQMMMQGHHSAHQNESDAAASSHTPQQKQQVFEVRGRHDVRGTDGTVKQRDSQAPPPPPAVSDPSAPRSVSPKKRRPPPAPKTAVVNTQRNMHESRQLSSQEFHGRSSITSSMTQTTSSEAGQIRGPVTTGFVHFLKSKGAQSSAPGTASESNWKDVLTEERPPWKPPNTAIVPSPPKLVTAVCDATSQGSSSTSTGLTAA